DPRDRELITPQVLRLPDVGRDDEHVRPDWHRSADDDEVRATRRGGDDLGAPDVREFHIPCEERGDPLGALDERELHVEAVPREDAGLLRHPEREIARDDVAVRGTDLDRSGSCARRGGCRGRRRTAARRKEEARDESGGESSLHLHPLCGPARSARPTAWNRAADGSGGAMQLLMSGTIGRSSWGRENSSGTTIE